MPRQSDPATLDFSKVVFYVSTSEPMHSLFQILQWSLFGLLMKSKLFKMAETALCLFTAMVLILGQYKACGVHLMNTYWMNENPVWTGPSLLSSPASSLTSTHSSLLPVWELSQVPALLKASAWTLFPSSCRVNFYLPSHKTILLDFRWWSHRIWSLVFFFQTAPNASLSLDLTRLVVIKLLVWTLGFRSFLWLDYSIPREQGRFLL